MAGLLRSHVALVAGVTALLAFTEPVTPRRWLSAQTVPGSEISVSLITVGQGSRAWEMFGHNAIRIRDASAGTDRSYNYGLFSFEQESFLLRFIQGRMLYWMGALETGAMLRSYEGENRTIWEQRLDIPPAQRLALKRFLEENARPANAYYRYDYYYDNCSTRVRDALDRATGGRLRAATESVATGTTFRSHTQRLTTESPLLYTGLLLGLGNAVDRPISAWEEMFLPVKLMEHLRGVTASDSAGRTAPLVQSERVLFQSTRPPEKERPPAWLGWYLLLGVGVGLSILWLGARARRSRLPRVGYRAVAGLWALVSGGAGFLLLGLWALTDHTAAYWNENLFFFSPLALPLAVLLFAGIHRSDGASRAASWLALAVAATSVIGFVVQVLPGFDQVNGQLIALALPANLGLAGAGSREPTADS